MPRTIATFDLTNRCPLRCAHCYYFAATRPAELGASAYLARLQERVAEHGIRSAFWVGGEPLVRLPLLRRALALVPRNAVGTSGMLPIPPDLDAGLLVSVEGPAVAHDRIRGSGAFDHVMRNLAALPAAAFALSVTLTAATLDVIEALPALVARTRALGALVGFHVAPAVQALSVAGEVRERAIDRLLSIREREPQVVLNSPAALALARPGAASRLGARCIYRDRALAFDAALEIKRPCTFGAQADCASCGCPVVAAQAARREGDGLSEELLRALFPASQRCVGGGAP